MAYQNIAGNMVDPTCMLMFDFLAVWVRVDFVVLGLGSEFGVRIA